MTSETKKIMYVKLQNFQQNWTKDLWSIYNDNLQENTSHLVHLDDRQTNIIKQVQTRELNYSVLENYNNDL